MFACIYVWVTEIIFLYDKQSEYQYNSTSSNIVLFKAECTTAVGG